MNRHLTAVLFSVFFVLTTASAHADSAKLILGSSNGAISTAGAPIVCTEMSGPRMTMVKSTTSNSFSITIGAISCTKLIDASSPKLVNALLHASPLSGSLTLWRTGATGAPEAYARITFSSALLASLDDAMSTSGVASEKISFTLASGNSTYESLLPTSQVVGF